MTLQPTFGLRCAFAIASRSSVRGSAHWARVMQTRFEAMRLPVITISSQTLSFGSPALIGACLALPGSGADQADVDSKSAMDATNFGRDLILWSSFHCQARERLEDA